MRKIPELLSMRGGFHSRVAWSPNGATIAVCNWGEATVDLFNAQSLELVRRWPHGHGGSFNSIAFSPDSQRILTTSSGIARVWDAATGTRLQDLVGHAGRVLCAVYSPDGKRIATGGNDHNCTFGATPRRSTRWRGWVATKTMSIRWPGGPIASNSSPALATTPSASGIRSRSWSASRRSAGEPRLAQVEPMAQVLRRTG